MSPQVRTGQRSDAPAMERILIELLALEREVVEFDYAGLTRSSAFARPCGG
ncbi:MAG: hypothetical protein WBP81_20640 [Solirubrobacteraceae bacterium]